MPFIKQKDLDALICAGQVMRHWLMVVDRPKEQHEVNGVRISQGKWNLARDKVFPGWNTPLERKIRRSIDRESRKV